MQGLLGHFGCSDGCLSPFVHEFTTFHELAVRFFNYMGPKYRKSSPHNCLDKGGVDQDADDDWGEAEEPTPTPCESCEDPGVQTLTALALSFASPASSAEGASDVMPPLCQDGDEAEDVVVVCEQFYRLLRMPQREDFDGGAALLLAAECLTHLGSKERGRADSLQKAKSLRGRWFCSDSHSGYQCRSGVAEVIGKHPLQRDQVIWHASTYFRILGAYQKGYNKFRLVARAPAGKEVLVHAVQVRGELGSFSENNSVPVGTRYQIFEGDALSTARFIMSLRDD
eukprot:GHVU01184787.1.p1 GENE.GHVU01184787.1~~GHVU01184787.1.p1  ORF type:complete len:283 (-),score=28.69 GHVU01184787.1:311-1159(-)